MEQQLDSKFQIVRSSSSGNWIITVAIGKSYLDRWKATVSESWLKYAEINDIGVIVITDDLIESDNLHWKKPNWQKLLIASAVLELELKIEVICYLDTDILINPFSPNVFNLYRPNKIGVVSLRKQLPFDYNLTLRKLALLRKTFIDENYPLDSALFIDTANLYKFHNLEPQEDEFCTGLFLFNAKQFAPIMKSWFFEYTKSVKSITNDGDQTHINYHVQSSGLAHFLPYEYQAIWSFEAANSYAFLFAQKFENLQNYRYCIQSTLLRVNFLHFAGSWTESSTFSQINFAFDPEFRDLYKNYREYSQVSLKGKPIGMIKPT
jgi:hypothetical protein